MVTTWHHWKPVTALRQARIGSLGKYGIIPDGGGGREPAKPLPAARTIDDWWHVYAKKAHELYGYHAYRLFMALYDAWKNGKISINYETAISLAKKLKQGQNAGINPNVLYSTILVFAGAIGGPAFFNRVSRAVADKALMEYLCKYPARSASDIIAREKLISVTRPDGSLLHVSRWAKINQVYGAADDVVKNAEGYYFSKYGPLPAKVVPRGNEAMYRAGTGPRLFDTFEDLIKFYSKNPDVEIPPSASPRIRRWCWQNAQARKGLIEMVKRFPKITTIVYIPMPGDAETVINFLIDSVNAWCHPSMQIPHVEPGVPIIKIPCWNYCTKPTKEDLAKGGGAWAPPIGFLINMAGYVWKQGRPTRSADKGPATPQEISRWRQEIATEKKVPVRRAPTRPRTAYRAV